MLSQRVGIPSFFLLGSIPWVDVPQFFYCMFSIFIVKNIYYICVLYIYRIMCYIFIIKICFIVYIMCIYTYIYTHTRNIPKEPWNTHSKGPMHPNVHSSTIYNSQVLEATKVPISKWVDQKTVVLLNNGILHSREKEGAYTLCKQHGWNWRASC